MMKWIVIWLNVRLTVYVFIGENWALLDFIDNMNNHNLFEKGEYVVLAIDNSIDDVMDNQVEIFDQKIKSFSRNLSLFSELQ